MPCARGLGARACSHSHLRAGPVDLEFGDVQQGLFTAIENTLLFVSGLPVISRCCSGETIRRGPRILLFCRHVAKQTAGRGRGGLGKPEGFSRHACTSKCVPLPFRLPFCSVQVWHKATVCFLLHHAAGPLRAVGKTAAMRLNDMSNIFVIYYGPCCVRVTYDAGLGEMANTSSRALSQALGCSKRMPPAAPYYTVWACCNAAQSSAAFLTCKVMLACTPLKFAARIVSVMRSTGLGITHPACMLVQAARRYCTSERHKRSYRIYCLQGQSMSSSLQTCVCMCRHRQELHASASARRRSVGRRRPRTSSF